MNKIVLIGTYPPQKGGIATFTQDCRNAMQNIAGKNASFLVAAVNQTKKNRGKYNKEVKWEIDRDNLQDYKSLAKNINNNKDVSSVIIQHEFGIFGGVGGNYINSFLKSCNKPTVVILHTVLPKPAKNYDDSAKLIVENADALVTFSKRSKETLKKLYSKVKGKIYVIPHGIHHTLFKEPVEGKKLVGLSNKKVISTFGLLSPNKGIEYVIRSLPGVIENNPDIIYMILGQTHPKVKERSGEKYRNKLKKIIKDLNLKDHVKFVNHYLGLEELIQYLQATDLYIATSLDIFQSSSGTFSYGLGIGRAVVSTNFVQAKEVLGKRNVGKLVSVISPESYTRAINSLLEKEDLLSTHKTAYKITRNMLWTNVARKYLQVIEKNTGEKDSWEFFLPKINLKHLINMTDDTGIFQFAKKSTPNIKFGYTLDDNARALITACWLKNKGYNTDKLINTYLKFIKSCITQGNIVNYKNYSDKKYHPQNYSENLEDSKGRLFWAIGEVAVTDNLTKEQKKLTIDIIQSALKSARQLKHLRSKAYLIKGLINIKRSGLLSNKLIGNLIDELSLSFYKEIESGLHGNWHWPEQKITYANGIIPETLFWLKEETNKEMYSLLAIKTLVFLINATFMEDIYIPIGNNSWQDDIFDRKYFDQQPEDPAAMITALYKAFEVTKNKIYLARLKQCFTWFLGNNLLGKRLYNDKNGGCYDALTPNGVNINQGAESLVSYLMSRLITERIA